MMLKELERAGLISALDRRLAELLGGSDIAQLMTSLVSARLREGHVCLELDQEAGRALLADDGLELGRVPGRDVLEAELASSPAVWKPTEASSQPREVRPLVLREGRLYLQRYDEHEQVLAGAWSARLGKSVELSSERAAADVRLLDRLFPPSAEVDLQRRAAEMALREPFVIVSGGPGTGKTATVARILALLSARALEQGETPPRVVLLAPTGKAAARMKESLAAARSDLLAKGLPDLEVPDASTIHRALGVRADNKTRFWRNAENPLIEDVVIVDEASMVDLSLMRRLVEALRPDTRLILLGDRHQLASVEAGSVLAELWAAFRAAAAKGGEGPLVELTRSFRFGPDSGIAALATAVRDGDGPRALELLDERRADLRFLERPTNPRQALDGVEAEVVAGFRDVLRAPTAEEALRLQTRFRVLCAHRRGPFGVDEWNEHCRHWLTRADLLGSGEDYYAGRPLLITRNDPARGLYNGDMGLIRLHEGRPYAWFEGASGPRRFTPAQLPEHETAFALTIHKSQGSEFDRVLVVLPDADSPLLSRELSYTGVTRARREVIISGTREAVRAACGRSVVRASGLGSALSRRLLEAG
ncbi:MAG TPA: exodeoxyribonuclease V subunit alpha [Polyangiaceae bacterium]|nr:exodeoxyribonuclease V subunit alpha [Polyangiaceae bacterium]